MELHRLDGIEASGLDNIDILDVNNGAVQQKFNSSQAQALEALGYVHGPEIAYEIQDEEGNVVMYADAEENLYVVDGLGELGFLKKIGRGLKNAAKFVGKKVLKPAFKTFNRFVNPATILLRNGFLLAMKVNLFKVGERLRFGYLSDSEARRRGVNMAGFAKLKKTIKKAEKIYETAGGKKANLKKAILTGKGNRDKAVPLSGFELGNPADLDPTDEFTDPFEQFIVEADPDIVEAFINNKVEIEGLGEPASGAAIAAASGVVASVSALLTKISGVFDKAKNVKQQAQSLISKPVPVVQSKPEVTLPGAVEFITPKPSVPIPNALQRFTPQSSEISKSIALRLPQKTSGQTTTEIPITADPGTRTASTSAITENPPQSQTSPDKKGWLQKNQTPLLIGVGVLLAGGGIWYAVKSSGNKPKGSAVDGVDEKEELSRDELGRFVSVEGKKKSSKKKKGQKRSPQKLTPTVLL